MKKDYIKKVAACEEIYLRENGWHRRYRDSEEQFGWWPYRTIRDSSRHAEIKVCYRSVILFLCLVTHHTTKYSRVDLYQHTSLTPVLYRIEDDLQSSAAL